MIVRVRSTFPVLDIHTVLGCVLVVVLSAVLYDAPLWLYVVVITPSGFISANLSRHLFRRP